jgi:hypothetical protein
VKLSLVCRFVSLGELTAAISHGVCEPIPAVYSQEVASLIYRMLNVEPSHRPVAV